MPQDLTIIKPFLALKENEILTVVIYGEARGEVWEGMIAVLNVIRNRTNYSQFQDSTLMMFGLYSSVILKKYQFSCFLQADPNYPKLISIADKFDDRLHSDPLIDRIHHMCVIKDNILDNTDGATHYFTKQIQPPSWSSSMTKTAEIGNHLFFRS